MAIDFPNTPSTNQTFSSNGRTWLYDGAKWVLQVSAPNALINTNAQTANYTLVLTDGQKLVEMNVGSANILYVPTNASVAFPVGTSIDILQTGAGKTQILPVTSGTTTIHSANGAYLRAQWSIATLVKRATDDWVLFGDTATS